MSLGAGVPNAAVPPIVDRTNGYASFPTAHEIDALIAQDLERQSERGLRPNPISCATFPELDHHLLDHVLRVGRSQVTSGADQKSRQQHVEYRLELIMTNPCIGVNAVATRLKTGYVPGKRGEVNRHPIVLDSRGRSSFVFRVLQIHPNNLPHEDSVETVGVRRDRLGCVAETVNVCCGATGCAFETMSHLSLPFGWWEPIRKTDDRVPSVSRFLRENRTHDQPHGGWMFREERATRWEPLGRHHASRGSKSQGCSAPK